MSALERYLSQVSRHLVGLPAKLRQDVIMELRSHILAQVESEGGEVQTVVQRMGPPKETARSYIQIYGYGTGLKVLAVLAASILAFLTLPFSVGSPAFLGTVWMSNASLVVLIIFLIGVGVKVGSKAALAAGTSVAAARFLALGIALALGSPGVVTEPAAIAAFTLTTVAVALVGYMAAPREKPSPPEA
jgi:uncharacterized membrane protein